VTFQDLVDLLWWLLMVGAVVLLLHLFKPGWP
jgi:hypothetical protein